MAKFSHASGWRAMAATERFVPDLRIVKKKYMEHGGNERD